MQENFNFTSDQWRFVAARLISKTDKEAAAMIGIKPATASSWSNKGEINAYIENSDRKRADTVIDALEAHAVKAVMTVVKLMDSEDDNVRLRASLAVVEHTIGKPKQKQEITGADSGPLKFEVMLPDADSD